jgi:DNA-binding transcriptional LysR family regulator
MPGGLVRFALPVQTSEIAISQLWHPRYDADPAHRWLRGLVLAACKDFSPVS